MVVFRNITQRKRAEESPEKARDALEQRSDERAEELTNAVESLNIEVAERKRVEEALRASEAKLRGLYELSPLGIALTDMKGKFVEFNDSFRRMCGYSEEELMVLDPR